MIRPYPAQAAERDDWITTRRPARELLDPRKPYAFFVEDECSASGEVVPVATVFLTNRECPWRCVMCDLWRNTLKNKVPVGAIPSQIDFALSQLPPARHIKLYNSGSFFDPQAIPPEDYNAIADRVSHFDRVIVESHPALIGAGSVRFKELLAGRLEVAMGLETAHPEVLERLNKRMTLEMFSSAATFLHRNDIDLRTFILIQPPFMKPDRALYWVGRSLDFAFDCRATAATLIPTRANNGAMESLTEAGDFVAPCLDLLEPSLAYGLALKRGRVFADLWDLSRLSKCSQCFAARLSRLQQMNIRQVNMDGLKCSSCEKQS